MRTKALANPKVLEWARGMAGLELGVAARRAGVKPEQLELWESGERRPTITQLRKLANIYKRPLGVFFLEAPPPDEALPADFRRLDPEAGDAISPALRLAVRAARVRREAALELYAELGEVPPVFSLRAHLADDPERVSEKLRAALSVPVGMVLEDARRAFNLWRTAAEGAGVLVFQAEGVSVNEMRGFSISEHPLPAVVVNIKDAYAARSFSLLHELAHILLDRGGVCLLEESALEAQARKIEVFSNHVAGAALLPASSLLQEPETPRTLQQQMDDESIEAIANRYGASPEVVLRRLAFLGRVSNEFYQQKRSEYLERYRELGQRSKKGGYPSRARLAIARGGGLFARLVLEAYDEERITSSDVAELLGERFKHLERIRSAIQSTSSSADPA